jgi:hypothetical protein
MRRFTKALLLATCLTTGIADAGVIPSQIKNTVAFVYLLDSNTNTVPNGTGFFVAVQNPTNSSQSAGYFVTSKHVLQDATRSKLLPGVLLRVNLKAAGSQFLAVPLIAEGKDKNVFLHTDPAVDVAVIPAHPSQELFEYVYLPADMLTAKSDFDSLNIREGSEIFFVGLFLPYPGYQRNYPITRFGRVSLMTDEQIEWDHRMMDLYLVESGSFGGNSGSPVFFSLGSDRIPGSIVIGSPVIKIAGVMMGAYQDVKPLSVAFTSPVPVSQSSMGIAAVVPAYKLHEILFGTELRTRRGF